MVKVKDDAAMTEPKPSNSGHGPKIGNRKARHHHYPSHYHHYSFHQCSTFPPQCEGSEGCGGGGGGSSAPALFFFGPGFERQSANHAAATGAAYGNAGPSQVQNGNGSGGSEYVVLFHVNPGVTISFQIGDNLEVLRGPVTVPMVSTNSSPPIAMPVQVPAGHVVQQIVDESGTLRHVILSPQHPGLLPITQHNPQHYPAGPPNGTNQPPQNYHYPAMPPNFTPLHPHFHSNMPPGTHPIPAHPPCHSPPPNYYKDERQKRQYIKLKKKLHEKQTQKVIDGVGSNNRKDNLVNGIRRGKEKGMNSVGTSEDGEESSSVQDDEDSVHIIIIEMLSSVQAPQVSELSSRSALLQWAAPSRLSEASSNDSHELDISDNDLRYEVLLSDKSKEMKYKSIYNGTSLSCRIQDLRPGVEYSVCLQVHLDELQGSASDPLKFTTPPCEPDQPQPPKLITRSKNALQLRWNATNLNGSHLLHYILEYDEGKNGDFVEVHKNKGNQYTLQKLTPSTFYRFRLAAVNEVGKSLYSEVVTHCTSDNAPSQPNPPQLTEATIASLHLHWEKRPQDEDFILQMNDPHTKYGFMTLYNGRDTEYVACDLHRFTDYKFKLRSHNGGGLSAWSEEVTFQTLPDRPNRPSKPIVKGRIHAHSFRLKWEPPSDTGGAEITTYILEVNSGSGYDIVYSGTDTEAVCDSLTPGTTYQLRVSCESIGGRSNYSDPCTVTTDAIKPGICPMPRMQGKAKATSVVIRFTEPDYNGGAPILEYEVEMTSPDDSQQLVHKSKEMECTVNGLQPGCRYVFAVRAVNRIGPGPWSEPLAVCSGAAPPEPPSQPVTTCKSPFHIYVEWLEPASNGASITEYRLEMSPTDNPDQFLSIYQGSSNYYDVKNLVPFSAYYFRVQACNSAGYGLYSPISVTMTPAAPPSSVQTPKSEVTATSITLYWNEPANNGSEITHYVISLGDQTITTESPVLEHTSNNLQPETLYKIKIQAVNAVGPSTPSSTLRVTTCRLPPSAPKLECIGTGHNSLKLKWGEGKNLDYTQYCLEMENIRSKEYQVVFKGTAYTCKVTKLQEATPFKFRICASNDAGVGDYSEESVFVTNIAPPAAVKSPKVVEVEQKSCELEWMPTRNATSDPIEYIVQVSRLRDQLFKQVYRGPNTKCTVDNLEPGAEYCARVCPIRLSQSGELFGPYSSPTKFNTVQQEQALAKKVLGAQSGTPTHSHKSKGFLQSVLSQNKNMTLQQKVILYTMFVFLIGLMLAAVLSPYLK